MLKRIGKWLWEYRWVILAYGILAVFVAPLLYICRYAVMNADDFIFGAPAYHAFVDSGGAELAALKAAMGNTTWFYKFWQGSYVSVFLMSMQPGVFGLSLYRLVIFSMLCFTLAAPAFFLLTLNRYFLKMDKKHILLILAGYLFIITQFLPSAFEGFYWYNGSIYYIFTFNVVLCFMAVLMYFTYTKVKVGRILLFVLLLMFAFMVGGSNYPVALTGGVGMALFVAVMLHKRHKDRFFYLGLLGFFIGVFLLNALAQGNGYRASNYVRPHIVFVAMYAVRDFLLEGSKWLYSLLTLSFIALSIPAAKSLVKDSKLKFIAPSLMAVISIALMLSQYVPPIFGMGHKGPVRVENIRFMIFQLLLWANAINLYGYLYQRDKLPEQRMVIAFVMTLVLAGTALSQIPIIDTWGYRAINGLTDKTTQAFGAEIERRVAVFEDPDVSKIKFEKDCTNELLRPEENLWWWFNVWDYYRKEPLREPNTEQQSGETHVQD